MVMLNNILLHDLTCSFSFYVSVGVVSEGGRNEEDDIETKQRVVLPTLVHDTVQKDEGLIIFFPAGRAFVKIVKWCQCDSVLKYFFDYSFQSFIELFIDMSGELLFDLSILLLL